MDGNHKNYLVLRSRERVREGERQGGENTHVRVRVYLRTTLTDYGMDSPVQLREREGEEREGRRETSTYFG